ncbi:hypothetical protein [Carboxylicivirga sp. RSCT41]|uniref:hypothetical protein n=1 Tax=Carboxylicivirga agarovorans TaxID=3417570 RepID=UPI003D34AC68
MNKNIHIALLSLIIITGCNQRQTNELTNQTETVNETPVALQETKIIDEIGKYSSRYNTNVVTKLYSEALDNNVELNELDSQMKAIRSMETDSLFAYEDYARINNQYWSAVDNLLRQMKDSVLHDATKELVDDLKSSYSQSVSDFEKQKNIIREKRISLNDQHLLMQLFVTVPMIENFRRNEKPSIKSLENVAKEYERLILESKQYTTINK